MRTDIGRLTSGAGCLPARERGVDGIKCVKMTHFRVGPNAVAVRLRRSLFTGMRRRGVPFKVAVHASLDAIQSSGHAAPDGDPCADDGTDSWQLGYQGIHAAGV